MEGMIVRRTRKQRMILFGLSMAALALQLWLMPTHHRSSLLMPLAVAIATLAEAIYAKVSDPRHADLKMKILS